jgi:hypothetical protein
MATWSFTRRSRMWGAFAGLSVCALVAAIFPGAATAAPTVLENCPDPFPLSQVTEGQEVTGLTVAHGTEPGPLTGRVVGVLEDGIAPGMDMIIVRMSGSEITDPDTGEVWRGIWAGMSGSPVYADDGRLIGAVSYGLSYSPSDYAGVTPAEEMYRIRAYEGMTAQAKPTAKIPDSLAAKMQRAGATTPQVDEGFHQLPMPVAVSGVTEKRLRQLADRFGRSANGVRVGNGVDANEEATPITAGGNLAGSLSYGDISQVGTGTATAVCDGKVLGFGHPFLFNGANGALSMHGAKALYVETDVFDGSYKISNPTAPVGRITQDRMAGILGAPGALPPGKQISSHVAATNGNTRDGTTTLTQEYYSDDLPYLSTVHLLVNTDRVFDHVGPGTGTVKWGVEMTRPDGSTIRFSRTENYATRSDLAFAPTWDIYQSIRRIQTNDFENVRITDIDQDAVLDDSYHAYQLDSVRRLVKGSWVRLTPDSTINARAGSTLELKARLLPRDGSIGKPIAVRLSVPVGAGQAGRTGRLVVSGGASTKNPVGTVDTLPEYLSKLSKNPRNDRVFGTLTIARPGEDWMKRDPGDAPSHTTGTQWFTVKVR